MNEASTREIERPLWRRIVDFPLVALVIAIILYVVTSALAYGLGQRIPPMGKDATIVVQSFIAIALMLAIYKLVIVHLGECPRDDLPARGSLRNLGLGLGAGFVIFSLIVGVAAIADVYNVYGCCSTRGLAMDLIIVAIMPSFMEELLFRGILFRWIEEFGGTWAGLVLSSALFGLAHLGNPGATWVASAWIALEAGILLGGAYMLTRSLWMPIGVHAAWNFTQGEIYDVPVSGLDQHGLVEAELSGPQILTGGPFGLEASVIALAIATAAGLWLIILAVRHQKLVEPWWIRRRLKRVMA